MPESRDQVIQVGGIASESTFGTVRVVAVTPLPWLIEGFVRAAERFAQAAGETQETARETFLPVFEALNWAVSIAVYLRDSGRPSDPRLDALRFVRNRVHHQWASAIYFDSAAGEWKWYPTANLPPPDDTHSDPSGEQAYERDLAGNPVRIALDQAGQFLTTLAV